MSICEEGRIDKLLIQELADKVLLESNLLMSLDHLVRTLDASIFGLRDILNGWSEDGVMCLLESLGKDFLS